jgi:PBP4 family serine-type D-alanyl-D-alanine carboxypeptidase
MAHRKRNALMPNWILLPTLLCLWSLAAAGQSASELSERIHKITSRAEFAHAHFGIEFYSLDSGKVLYALNPAELMVPGSTTKLLTEGTILELLGGDYRFHTRIYRIGAIKHGKLKGDLVLVASGDPNLSGRIQPDGTLAYENEDHSYGGRDSKGIGDPLLVIRELADQIAAKGIKRIEGRVLVDVSLFPEGERELGTNVVISPIVVNDNVVDIVATGGAKKGDPVTLQVSPKTSYMQVINQATTAEAGAKSNVDLSDDKEDAAGMHTITLAGSLAPGASSGLMSHSVAQPSKFAATLLTEALQAKGIVISPGRATAAANFKDLAARYIPENIVAEHVSPPLREDVKITLKVSQNLHASMAPSLVGALVAHKDKDKDISQAGFDAEHEFLTRAGLDLSSAAQSDGAGGNAFFTADFMVHYLTFMTQQKDFADFRRGLPLLGQDGTLFKIQVNSPAAGHVQAKTGTYVVYDALNKRLMITGKGLAGYVQTKSGQNLVFAAYVNMVEVSPDDPDAVSKTAGEALGEIAAAAYDSN